jgi:N-acetyl-gamma-glutamyl-phosphate reductase
MKKINVGIIGAGGNGGGELIRYLSQHPTFVLTKAYGERSAGKTLAQLYPWISKKMGEIVVGSLNPDISAQDVALFFLSLPTGKSAAVAARIPEDIAIVDLGGDHRFADGWTYNIPEVDRQDLSGVMRLSNPGCYPTAIMLALAPLLGGKDGLLPERIIINAISGMSGMGRGSKGAEVFSDMNEDAHAYRVFGHPHIPEIKNAIHRAFDKLLPQIIFVPQYVPMTRGISAVCIMKKHPDHGDIDYNGAARKYYDGCEFVQVCDQPPHIKWVSGTNRAYVHYAWSAEEKTVIALSVIDNLGKGAAGQAIQNANMMFGLPAETGLSMMPL